MRPISTSLLSRLAAFNSTKNSEKTQNNSEIPVTVRRDVQSFESGQSPPPVCQSSMNVCEEEPLTRVQSSQQNNTQNSDIMGLSQANIIHGSRRTRSKKQ